MADKKAIKGVIYLIAVTSILLTILIAGNNTLLPLLAVYIGMLIVSAFIINSKDFKGNVIGLRRDNLGKSIAYAFGVAIVFYIIAKATGLSISLPFLPNSIGTQTRFFTILILAPIIETIFFQISVFAVLLTMTSRRLLSIILTSIIFSFSHLAAYISGLYDYPSVVTNLQAISSNAGSFLAAFLFSFVAMIILVQKKITNNWFTITLHFLLNLIVAVILSIIIIS